MCVLFVSLAGFASKTFALCFVVWEGGGIGGWGCIVVVLCLVVCRSSKQDGPPEQVGGAGRSRTRLCQRPDLKGTGAACKGQAILCFLLLYRRSSMLCLMVVRLRQVLGEIILLLCFLLLSSVSPHLSCLHEICSVTMLMLRSVGVTRWKIYRRCWFLTHRFVRRFILCSPENSPTRVKPRLFFIHLDRWFPRGSGSTGLVPNDFNFLC